MRTCYIALGSNLGNRKLYLQKAVNLLQAEEQIQVLTCSSIFETPPWGLTEQPFFYNAVCKIQTNLTLLELLAVLQHIESLCGRERAVVWGPRTLDLDILYCEGETISHDMLCVPHPHMWQRLFVLVPLEEIYPELVYQSKSIREYIKCLPDEKIERISEKLYLL